jgi:glyoxylase-like metal-dependent hydrolase (beta-lactamase superfamily II)/dienelactone hydrolase
MTVYSPAGKNTGAAVVVFPGGGFQVLAIDLEGTEVCEWLTSRGVTCILSKYRVPSIPYVWQCDCRPHNREISTPSLEDAQRTLRLVRSHAAEWRIDPHKVGVLGFSAGGYLVAEVSTRFNTRVYAPRDAADRESSRADFAIAIYPGHLSLAENSIALNPDIKSHITPQTPPTFLLQNEDDEVDRIEDALSYYMGLKAAHVPVELHAYAQGGHAFGIRPSKLPVSGWPQLVDKWLGTIGMVSVGDDPPEWSTPVKPFRIAGSVYYVGTKGLAAYLIVSDQGAILLDGTTAENAPLIERNIEAVGVPLRTVKRLISDHAHSDHVGALAQIKRDTGAEFLASARDQWALEHGRVRGDTHYTPEAFPPIKVDRVVRDGETIQLGRVTLTAHSTPGHTPGCTSWSTTVEDQGRPLDVLFLCSITVAGNVLVGNHAYPEIVSDYRATFRKLETMKADILLPSHPDMADVIEREGRREAGEADAFIDPKALPLLVAESSAAFEEALAAGR